MPTTNCYHNLGSSYTMKIQNFFFQVMHVFDVRSFWEVHYDRIGRKELIHRAIHLVRTQIFRKTNISYSVIRTRTCAYQRVRNISSSENLRAYYVNDCKGKIWIQGWKTKLHRKRETLEEKGNWIYIYIYIYK